MPRRSSYDPEEMYAVDGAFLNELIDISKRLYDPKPLTGDEKRDMANFLDASVTGGSRVEGPLEE